MTSLISAVETAPPSSANYFNYDPEACAVSPIKAKKPKVHCLDAFHKRPDTPSFEYPSNASLYVKRALPPLPPPLSALPGLQRCISSESLCSGPSRPGTAMTNRQSCDKALPPLPSLQPSPSIETMGCKEIRQPSRPRANTRNLSFRGLIDRYSSSSSSTDDVPSLNSSMSSVGTRDSRSDSVLDDYTLTQVTTNATTISSATISRRPSTLSLTQLRAASKKVNAAPPPLPTRPRKHSTSAGSVHRWNPFGRGSEEDKEDIPPMPCTPPFVQELSFGQCYYFFARNCNGYVLSNGVNGDACENCARSGYLGSP